MTAEMVKVESLLGGTQPQGSHGASSLAHALRVLTSDVRELMLLEMASTEVLRRLLPELQAIPNAQVVQVNRNVPTLITVVLGLLPRIKACRAGILRSMPDYDGALFDKLEDYLVALDDAHAVYLAASRPPNELAAALEAGTRLRARLLADATALIHRGVLNSSALAGLKGVVGYKNLATDLSLLAKVLGVVLEKINGRSGVTSEELEHAVDLHWTIYRAVGLRQRSVSAISVASNLRQRVFTALLKCYDHVRHGVTALRWKNGDANEIAPALLAISVGTRKKVNAAAGPIPTQEGNAVSVVTSPSGAGIIGVSTLNADLLPLVADGAGAGSGAQATGKPGADPFL